MPEKERGLFKCEACSYESDRLQDLNRHFKTVHNRNLGAKCKCLNCSYETDMKYEWNKHERKCGKERVRKIRVCTECTYKSSRKDNYDRHIRLKHSSVTKNGTDPRLCLRCPKSENSFKTKKGFQNHEYSHKKINRTCSRIGCNANFESINSYRNPMAKHFRKHCCWICKIELSSKNNLKKHMFFNHKCKLCPRTFGRRSMLLFHLRTNHGSNACRAFNDKYSCGNCNKLFFFSGNMIRHSKTCFLKTFKCKQCEKLFASEYALSQHIKLFHVSPLNCFH